MSESPPPLKFIYKNYKGEIGLRIVTPLRTEYRASDWHPDPQWILVAYDHDKGGHRDFAMNDIVRFEK